MAGHKIALITDTHFGVRKGSQLFHDYFRKFYEDTFFPFLDRHNVDTVVHLGDCFDNRKTIDYWSLDWAKKHFFDVLQQKGIELHLIVGNHDIFYKESLSVNSPALNLREYDNISLYSSPETATIKGTDVFMVPWICTGNAERFVERLDATDARICMGHLELAGFYANKDYKCNHGTDPKVFNQFDTVFSGHFHKKSSAGNVTYLGNPYQLYWNDEGDPRGFHLFDLETRELEFIENPNRMFNKVFYNEGNQSLINPNKLIDTYVKVIVEHSTPVKLAKFVDKLYEVGIHDLKLIENFDLQVEDDVVVEAEDTLTTLTNYVTSLDGEVNKESLVGIFKSLYVEAQEL